MTMVWRKIKRTGHEAFKFNFNIIFKELHIDFNDDKRPKEVSITCMHRRRKYDLEARPLQKSFSEAKRCLIVWPDVASNCVDIETTLFKDPNKDQYDNKEWTIIVEEVNKKGKKRPLAALSLNLCFFVNDSPDLKTELKLKMRPLQKIVDICTLSLVLTSTLLRKGKATDDDLQSIASIASASKIPPILYEHDNEVKVASQVAEIRGEFDKWKEEVVKPAPLPAAKNAWGEEAEIQPPPPLPPHRGSSSETPPVLPPRISRDSIQSSTERRRDSSNSVIKNLPPPPPTIIKDESLLKWCQRVTSGYKNVKINDLSKSWRNGLGFCSILHRYDPSLLGNFEELDFSNTKNGQKFNCNKAFTAAETIGVERTLDENEVPIYTDEKKITEYLNNLRIALQGPDACETVDARKSEYRISTIYGLSETEKTLMRDLERMRLMRGEDETDKAVAKPQYNAEKIVDKTTNEDTVIAPIARTRRDSIKELEEHEKKLKEMTEEMKKLANEPLTPPSPTSIENNREDEEEKKKRRLEEARMLLKGEIDIYPNNSPRYVTQRQGQYNFYSVRSTQASPAIERKTYTHKRHGSDLSNKIMPSTSTGNPHDAPNGAQPNAFDRVKRYGSMKGVELAETLALFVGGGNKWEPIKPNNVGQDLREQSNSVDVTPTRKIVTNFEKNVIQISNINEELQRISDRLEEIERLNKYIEEKRTNIESDSEEEKKILTEKMKLLTEKDSLVRRQDYLNLSAAISEVEEKIAIKQQEINEVTQNSDDYKTEDEKRRIDKLVNEFKELIDKKNELSMELLQKESEEEEHDERGRRTLERTKNFSRGIQEPVNASRRIMNWIKSTTG